MVDPDQVQVKINAVLMADNIILFVSTSDESGDEVAQVMGAPLIKRADSLAN